MTDKKIVIAVIGGHDVDEAVADLAYKTGRMIARLGCVLACGGLAGVMEAAAKGAKAAGGMTIGILPGKDKEDANPFIDIPLPTSIGYARNAIVACCADFVVALPGSHGTRSEISYALVYKRPLIDLGHWNIEGMIKVDDVTGAEKKIRALIAKKK